MDERVHAARPFKSRLNRNIPTYVIGPFRIASHPILFYIDIGFETYCGQSRGDTVDDNVFVIS